MIDDPVIGEMYRFGVSYNKTMHKQAVKSGCL